MADVDSAPSDKKEVVEKKVEEDGQELEGGLDDLDLDGDLKLTSKCGTSISIKKKWAFVSVLVKTSIENDETATEVPLPGVDGPILKLVTKYMQHHEGVEPPIVESPLKSTVMKEVCQDKWDAEFIDNIGEIRQSLYDLILAANYMDIKSLLHLGLAKVASLIKGQPLDKLKDILSTENDDKRKKEMEANAPSDISQVEKKDT
jgi:hypothetical protein